MAIPRPRIEEWCQLTAYEERYAISSLGRIYSYQTDRVMRLQVNRLNDQVCVNLTDSFGNVRRRSVAQLVLETFDKPCPPGMEACHGPAGFLDNAIDNLSWDTPAKNQRDRDRDGTSNRGERQGSHKRTEDEIREIRRLAAQGWQKSVLAVKYDMSATAIGNIVARRTWSHVGDT